MGGGASVLSSEDFVTMSQNLKEEYELLITSGYTDDEIRAKLMDKYNELFVTSDPNITVTDGVEVDPSGTVSEQVADSDKPLIMSDSVVSLSGVEVSAAVPETTVQLTEKAKKARKRRGTFENDKVVTAAKQPPSPLVAGVIIESLLEE